MLSRMKYDSTFEARRERASKSGERQVGVFPHQICLICCCVGRQASTLQVDRQTDDRGVEDLDLKKQPIQDYIYKWLNNLEQSKTKMSNMLETSLYRSLPDLHRVRCSSPIVYFSFNLESTYHQY